MFALFDFLYNLFTTLAKISFWTIAISHIYYCCRAFYFKKKLKLSEYIFFFVSNFAILFSVITHIFFPVFHKNFFDIISLLYITVCIVWSGYEDKVLGRRWWNW